MTDFKPELGQAFFGNAFSEYDCPDFIEAGLMLLEKELQRIMWNINQKRFESAISGGDDYVCPVFEIHPYFWGDEEEEKIKPNFKCGDFEIRWCKHMGRGMSMNKPINEKEFFFIGKCLNYLREVDRNKFEELRK